MTVPDELDYDRAAARIGRLILVLAGGGIVTSFVIAGWKGAAGFLLGSMISGLNYRWLRRLVEALGGEQRPRRKAVVSALRYLLLGVIAYAILRYSPISVAAVWAGVFVLTAAVIIEAVIEIVYARK